MLPRFWIFFSLSSHKIEQWLLLLQKKLGQSFDTSSLSATIKEPKWCEEKVEVLTGIKVSVEVKAFFFLQQ